LKKAFYISFVIILLFSGKFVQAQVSHFSQFYSNPLTIGPSFAGFTGNSRIALNYRDQWPGIAGAGTFVTYSVAADHYFQRAKSGVGIVAFRDQAGSGNLSLTELGAMYSYVLKFGKKSGRKNTRWFLRPGLYFKYSQRSVNFGKLTFTDMFDSQGNLVNATIEQAPLPDIGYLDFSTSLLAYAENFWAGFTVDHLLMPDQSLTGSVARVPMKLAMYGGYRHLLGSRGRNKRHGKERESITFTGHYRIQGADATFNSNAYYDQLDIGAYWTYDPWVLGAWVRGLPVFGGVEDTYNSLDAVIVLIGFKVNSKLRMGYSYDATVSNLLSHTGGAHEISITYQFNQNKRKNKQHKHAIVPCPSF